MKLNKKEIMYKRIQAHGANLLVMFPAAKYQDAVELCKKLRRQELAAEKLTTELCNGTTPDRQNYAECQLEKIRLQVCQYLGIAADASFMFINHDPRGYALKLSDNYMNDTGAVLYKDWGGYGILAPDFSE